MKITKSQLQQMIKEAVETNLQQEPNQEEPAQETQTPLDAKLEDAVSLLNMIIQRIMSFPTSHPNSEKAIDKIIDALEKIDGYLGKYVNLQERKINRKK